MDRSLLFLSLLLLFSVSVSHADDLQVYWQKVLPHASMPSAIRDLIRAAPTTSAVEDTAATVVNVDKGTQVGVGGGGIHVSTPKGTTVNVGHGGVNVNTGHAGKPPIVVHDKGTQVGVGGGGVHVSTPKGTTVNVGHGGVNVNTGHAGKPPVVVLVRPFNYLYAASDTQIHDDPRVALFFLEKDLHPGTKVKLTFTKTASSSATFITRTKANSIPFSSAKLPQILKRFAIDQESTEAERMKKTLDECELPAAKGEIKHCATSLESMVEFSTESLGTRDIMAVSTTVDKDAIDQEKEYTIKMSGVERVVKGNKLVACHLEEYAYAVFYCHVTRRSRAYTVKMAARDGAEVEAVAVCHTDTAGWNPKHVAFRVLGVKPGSVPVCHFLPQDHVVWGLRS